MGDVSDSKMFAKYDYWHMLPLTKQKFFMVMLGDFEHQMKIPRKFSENFRENWPWWCTLQGESGNKWKVEVKRGEGEGLYRRLLFSRGWDTFVKDHGIQAGDLLVFRYKDSFTFKVSVFDKTACEREESHFAICSSVPQSKKKHSDGTETQEERYAESSSASLKGKKKMRSQRNHYDAGVYKGGTRVDNWPNCEIDHDDGRNDDDNEEEYRAGYYEVDEEEEEEEEEKEEKTEELAVSDDSSSFESRKQVQKCFISRRREVTDNERKEVVARTEDYLKRHKYSGVPKIGITMLSTHVYRGHYLTIPKDWAREYMMGENHEVQLQVPGSNDYWRVGCRWIKNASQCQFRPKWAEFVLHNNLEEGDVCVFQLVQRGSRQTRAVMNVRIFRVVPEIVPLIQKRATN